MKKGLLIQNSGNKYCSKFFRFILSDIQSTAEAEAFHFIETERLMQQFSYTYSLSKQPANLENVVFTLGG